MRFQWKRFRRILWGCTGSVWLLCCSGILLVDDEQFLVRMALLFMLVLTTGMSIYLYVVARRETRALDRMAIEVRAALNKGP